MKKQHYDWWGLVRSRVKKYPDSCFKELRGTELRWRNAIKKAVDATMKMPNGENRMRIIRMVYWDRTRTLGGAALAIPCSDRTASRWQRSFFEEVARNIGLLD